MRNPARNTQMAKAYVKIYSLLDSGGIVPALVRQEFWEKTNYLRLFMVSAIKHYTNPLHIYCRLRDMGLRKRPAAFLCRIYERAVFKRYIMLKD